MKKIINYLENPKDKGDGTVDFDRDILEEKLNKLDRNSLYELAGKVDTVCIQFETLRVMPNNDMPTIARYQLTRELLKKKLT